MLDSKNRRIAGQRRAADRNVEILQSRRQPRHEHILEIPRLRSGDVLAVVIGPCGGVGREDFTDGTRSSEQLIPCSCRSARGRPVVSEANRGGGTRAVQTDLEPVAEPSAVRARRKLNRKRLAIPC